jgi:hypothetical protein
MSVLFTVTGSSGTSVSFDTDEATSGNDTTPTFSIEIGQEKTAGGVIKQQIRPGKRFRVSYAMVLEESKYIGWLNLITDGSNEYFIEYTDPPSILTNDSTILQDNNFKISFSMGDVEQVTASETGTIQYHFDLDLASVELL